MQAGAQGAKVGGERMRDRQTMGAKQSLCGLTRLQEGVARKPGAVLGVGAEAGALVGEPSARRSRLLSLLDPQRCLLSFPSLSSYQPFPHLLREKSKDKINKNG